MLNEGPFNIVIIDNNLPKLMGSVFVKELRIDNRNSNAVVVCVTGSTSRKDVEKVYAAGVDLYMPKPINSNDFIYGLCEQIYKRGVKLPPSVKPLVQISEPKENVIRTFVANHGDRFTRSTKSPHPLKMSSSNKMLSALNNAALK